MLIELSLSMIIIMLSILALMKALESNSIISSIIGIIFSMAGLSFGLCSYLAVVRA